MDNDIKTLNNIFKESAAPDKAFIERLESDVISQYNKKPQLNLLNILFMKIPNNALKFGIISLAVVSVLSITGGASYIAYDRYFKPSEVENQDEILAMIANKNQKRDYDESASRVSTNGAAEDQKLALWMPLEDRDYNYTSRIITYNVGPSASKCKIVIPYEGKVTSDENYQFYTSNKERYPSYSKYVSYINSDIYTYSLNAEDSQWLYNGGRYAVNIMNAQKYMPLAREAMLSDPPQTLEKKVDGVVTDLKETPTNTIYDRFGKDVKILDTIKRDGKELYKIQWSYDVSCSNTQTGDVVSSALDTKSVSVAFADSKDFTIIEESLYLDSAKESNRIYTVSTKEEFKTVSGINDVKDIFTFNIPTEVKKYDLKDYDYSKEYKTELINYLSRNSFNFAYINNSVFDSQSASGPSLAFTPSNEEYLIDRSFYSPSSYGQEMYDNAKSMYKVYLDKDRISPMLSLSYNSSKLIQSSWLNLNIYDKEYSKEDILKSLYFDKYDSKGTLELSINNTKIQSSVYSRVLEQRSTPPSTGAGSSEGNVDDTSILVPEEYEITDVDFAIVFNYEGKSYSIGINANKDTKVSTLAKNIILKSVNTKDINTLNKVISSTENRDLIMY